MGNIQRSYTTPDVQIQILSAPPSGEAAKPKEAATGPEKAQATQPKDSVDLQSPERGLPAGEVRFVFMSDNHSRSHFLRKIDFWIQQHEPDFIIDGGDMVHDGTEPELKRAFAKREALSAPVYPVTGNHDAELRGPFSEDPPHIPDFQSKVINGLHVILLDNEAGHMSEAQFKKLEAALSEHADKPSVVAMHVPAMLSQEPLSVKISKFLPLNFASPTMPDQAQVERFHQLMVQHDVQAVLTGHTHYADEMEKDGVRYVTVGSSGGLTPKPGLDKEFLDVRVNAAGVDIQRVQFAEGRKGLGYLSEAFDFYRDLNNFNHDELGWESSFVPSVNLGYQAGLRTVHSDRGSSVAVTAGLHGERIMSESGKGSVFGSVGVSAATGKNWDMGLQTSVGYRQTVLGDYNRGVFVSAAGTANGGYLHGAFSAGVGVKAGVGVNYRNFGLELSQEWATNYDSAQYLNLSYRF